MNRKYSPFERPVIVMRPLMLLERLLAVVLLVTIFECALEKHLVRLLIYLGRSGWI